MMLLHLFRADMVASCVVLGICLLIVAGIVYSIDNSRWQA